MRSDDYKNIMNRMEISPDKKNEILNAAESAQSEGNVENEPVEVIRHIPWYRRTGVAVAASLVLVAGIVGAVGVNMMSGKDLTAGSDTCDSSGADFVDASDIGSRTCIQIAPATVDLKRFADVHEALPRISVVNGNECFFVVDDNWFIYDFNKQEIVFSADMKKTFADAGYTGTGYGDKDWSGIFWYMGKDYRYPILNMNEYDKILGFSLNIENNLLIVLNDDEMEKMKLNEAPREIVAPPDSWEDGEDPTQMPDGGYVGFYREIGSIDENPVVSFGIERCLKAGEESEHFVLSSKENPMLGTSNDNTVTLADGTTIKCTKVSTKSLILEITENEKHYTYGKSCKLERFVEGKWVDVPFKTDDVESAMAEAGYAADDNGNVVVTFWFGDLYEPLEEGEYRLTTPRIADGVSEDIVYEYRVNYNEILEPYRRVVNQYNEMLGTDFSLPTINEPEELRRYAENLGHVGYDMLWDMMRAEKNQAEENRAKADQDEMKKAAQEQGE